MYKRPVFTLLPIQEETPLPFQSRARLEQHPVRVRGARVTEEEAAQSHHLHGSQTLSVSSVTTSGVFLFCDFYFRKKKNTMLYDGFT